MTYGYESTTGRFALVGWNSGTKSGTASYSYLTNSEIVNGYTSSNGLAVSYFYENNRNLKTQVKNEFGINVVSQYDYLYNQIGNRTQMNTSGSAFTATPNLTQQNTTYLTNNLNQYNKVTDQFPQPTENNLNYDEDGNLVSIIKSSEGTRYSYNAENQLIKVEPMQAVSGTTKVEFAYDYMSRRVDKKVFTYNAGSWILTSDSLFLYDGWNMISEQITHNPQPVTEKLYINGLDLSQTLQGAGGIGGLVASVDSGTTKMYYYFSDTNGNINQLIDSADGSLTAHYEYDPYGNLLAKSGSYADQNPYRFSTKYFDNETGLGYWTYRYYSPSLGRWGSRDPMEEWGGFNLYTYVRNNPVNGIDLFGLIGPQESSIQNKIDYYVLTGDLQGLRNLIELLRNINDVANLALALNALEQAEKAKADAEARTNEHDAYKARCQESPPPGLDKCEEARWKLQRNIDCKNMREEWDRKWQPGRHNNDIDNLDRSIKNLKKWIEKNCCEEN